MKSHNIRYLEVVEVLIEDISTQCSVDMSHDYKNIVMRVENEGLSFLTITMPSFCRDFERCLDERRLVPGLFRAFRKRLRGPAFLQGLLGRIFDYEKGGLLNEEDVSCISAIRQLTLLFKKIKLPCTPRRIFSAMQNFIQVEAELDSVDDSVYSSNFVKVAEYLWSGLADFNSFELRPKHGPGSTAERIMGNQKYVFRVWYDSIEDQFPFLHYGYTVSAYGTEIFDSVEFIPRGAERPVRVVSVPKTLSGPRIIAIEPVCMQYAQQAVSDWLVDKIESSPLTAGHVNFTDQTVNQSIAIAASDDRQFSTLDLSSASDRVPLVGVEVMLRSAPSLLTAAKACRSEKAELLDSIVYLKKFASMGSALCFPIESMYFYTICVEALLDYNGLSPSYSNIRKVIEYIFIYGDDIIVPVDATDIVIDYLHKYMCKVNTTKSFAKGNFRESCGADAYRGELVTPVYLRSPLPDNKRDAQSLISTVATSNQLHLKGYWRTSAYLKKYVERIIGKLPVIGKDCSGLGWVSFCGYTPSKVYDKDLQHEVVKTYVPQAVYHDDKLDDYPALTKCLLMLTAPQTVTEKDHLVRTARFGAVTLKRRWVRPY